MQAWVIDENQRGIEESRVPQSHRAPVKISSSHRSATVLRRDDGHTLVRRYCDPNADQGEIIVEQVFQSLSSLQRVTCRQHPRGGEGIYIRRTDSGSELLEGGRGVLRGYHL
jgi:hypothetical protein